MSNDIDSLKADLLEAPWRKYKDVTVEGRRGPVQLIIRRPPPNVMEDLTRMLREATKAEESNVENSDAMAMDAMAAVVSKCVWLPNAVCPLFTPEEARAWPYLMDVLSDCVNAIKVGAGVEAAKGKSEATST